MRILITGSSGFIGYHLCEQLLKDENIFIIGLDNMNNYYDVNLKISRLHNLKLKKNFKFIKADINNTSKLQSIIKNYKINYVIHLAAQAGVRYSIKNPQTYFENNIQGFFNILELARINNIKHLVYASTSSVYGSNSTFPLSEEFNTDKPLSFYAATKKSNEVMAYAYSNIYNIPITGLRFFTVYGPYGRPDMSLFMFASNIIKNKTISLFNNGEHTRDFTYIDDVVDGIIKSLVNVPNTKVPYSIYNIGNGKPRSLKKFLSIIEKKLNKKAIIKKKPLQQGDVIKTHADINKISKKLNYNPKTSIEVGIEKFIGWILKNKS